MQKWNEFDTLTRTMESTCPAGTCRPCRAAILAAAGSRTRSLRQTRNRGASVNATDAQDRTSLQLVVKACADSYWTDRRSPDSLHVLLEAGASAEGIELPTGYEEIDVLLRHGVPIRNAWCNNVPWALPMVEEQFPNHHGVIMRLVVRGEDQRDPAMLCKRTQPI